jgi:hypothetical protein
VSRATLPGFPSWGDDIRIVVLASRTLTEEVAVRVPGLGGGAGHEAIGEGEI